MLTAPPTTKHLSRMYYELGLLGANAVGEKTPWPYSVKMLESLLALGAEMSRFDPRLLGVLTEFIYFHWQEINPYLLRQEMHRVSTPQTVLVIFELAFSDLSESECRYLLSYLSQGFVPVATQLYFKNLYAPASRNMQRAAEEPLQEFVRWGFLARERPVIHGSKRKNLGSFSQQARQNIIRRLAKEQEVFRISDYLNAVEQTISRQQALQDLKDCSLLTMQGKGRGCRWLTSS